ncbi:hypothetical protein [Achromobacter sp. AONIH1]|uniref:hypothetical protein n=1 Tax=Achromobacter sp. AONIH1 TaxID=1758194 RepID=UPI000CD02598|nr:hypothetical protein [Achromobacter sp. AONIH1]AUT49245.1 hypothetical protein C2U31_26600 [Achromobacter sp. AONIH1]
MTNQYAAAQAAKSQTVLSFDERERILCQYIREPINHDREMAIAIEAAVLSNLRAPVTGEAQPAAYLTLDEEGSPRMLFFDVVEARSYCALGEEPEPLFRNAARQASADDVHNAALEALEAARRFIRNGIEFGYIRMPDADKPDPAHRTPGMIDAAIRALKQLRADKAARCTCPSGDGSLRHPCPAPPQTNKGRA